MTESRDDADGAVSAADAPEESEVSDESTAEAPRKRDSSLRTLMVVLTSETLLLLVIALVLYYVMLTFVARPYLIPSESMEPTLHGCAGCVGDRIMVFHRPARIAYEARMDAASREGSGRQAVQDEILKVLSLEAGEGMPAAPAAVI